MFALVPLVKTRSLQEIIMLPNFYFSVYFSDSGELENVGHEISVEHDNKMSMKKKSIAKYTLIE